MDSENQQALLEEKLYTIEKNILDENNSREYQNRMPARYFTVFFLIGGDRKVNELLQRKVQGLLSNPRACAFLQTEENRSLGEMLNNVLNYAAQNRVNVETLNTVLLCPVLFSSAKNNNSFITLTESVCSYLQKSGKNGIWQPYLIIRNATEEYPDIYRSITEMQQFVMSCPSPETHRCCILTDLDEHGFSVSLENILETIAVCTILQNTSPRNPGAMTDISRNAANVAQKAILNKNDLSAGTVFFTARSASVSAPIRSLTFQRMISALKFLAGDTDETSRNALDRADLRFIADAIAPCLEKLPHLNGFISFFPLYGVIDGPDLVPRLRNQLERYYSGPLKASQDKVSAEIRQKFFQEFFIERNGCLKELNELVSTGAIEGKIIQRSATIPMNIPLEPDPELSASYSQTFRTGAYEGARRECEALVKGFLGTQLEQLIRYLKSPETRRTVAAAQSKLRMIVECIRDRQTQLAGIETVLDVYQTELHTSFDDTADDWFRANIERDRKFAELNREFDNKVCEMVLNGTDDFSNLLQVCYETVRSKAERNMDYLYQLHNICSRYPDKAREFADKVAANWCYTLRLIRPQNTDDITFLVGDDQDSFFGALAEKFHAQQFVFRGFDSIGVLHFSAPFAAKNINTWAQIKEDGEKAGENGAAAE